MSFGRTLHLWGPMTHCVRWGPWPPREGEVWVGWTPSQKLNLPTYDSPGGSTDQRFRLLRNHVRLVFFISRAILHRAVASVSYFDILTSVARVYVTDAAVQWTAWKGRSDSVWWRWLYRTWSSALSTWCRPGYRTRPSTRRTTTFYVSTSASITRYPVTNERNIFIVCCSWIIT